MPSVRTSLDISEQRCFSPVVNSPRIRGRLEFNDLLMLMERERHKELEGLVARRAVSKFSHRGRIQALLRFKFLRQGIEAKEAIHSKAASADQVHKLLQFADMNFMERVKSSVLNSSAHIESYHKDLRGNIPAIEKGNENQHQELIYPELNLEEFEKTCKAFHDIATEPSKKALDSIISLSMHTKDEEDSQGCDEGKVANELHLLETCPNWRNDVCHAGMELGWEEENSEYQQEEGNDNIDWIYEVSRPRSEWEGHRQERYQEMLHHFIENEEIRSLIERKSVSKFLSSDLRNQIDRVMLSRAQGQQVLINDRTREEQKCLHEEQISVVEGEDEVDKQQDEEKGNYDDYYDEASTYSSQVASPSPQRSLSSNYSPSNISTVAHPAIEIELIYDLRRQMEKLQQEMSKLRRSIRGCMDMHCKLQRSIKRDVGTTVNHSDEKKGGGTCSLCCQMPID